MIRVCFLFLVCLKERSHVVIVVISVTMSSNNVSVYLQQQVNVPPPQLKAQSMIESYDPHLSTVRIFKTLCFLLVVFTIDENKRYKSFSSDQNLEGPKQIYALTKRSSVYAIGGDYRLIDFSPKKLQ